MKGDYPYIRPSLCSSIQLFVCSSVIPFTDMQVEKLTTQLFVCPTVSPSIHQYNRLYTYPSVHLCNAWHTNSKIGRSLILLDTHGWIDEQTNLWMKGEYLIFRPSIHLSAHLSNCLSIQLLVHETIPPSIWLSVHRSMLSCLPVEFLVHIIIYPSVCTHILLSMFVMHDMQVGKLTQA